MSASIRYIETVWVCFRYRQCNVGIISGTDHTQCSKLRFKSVHPPGAEGGTFVHQECKSSAHN